MALTFLLVLTSVPQPEVELTTGPVSARSLVDHYVNLLRTRQLRAGAAVYFLMFLGMSLYADGGFLATKPYAAGGAYIDRMSDFCGPCRYDPRKRTGEDACPYTAGYWAFLERNEARLRGNHRMRRSIQGMHRLTDLDALVDQERARGSGAP